MADHDGNHWCLVEKNVPIASILRSRWQDGAESLGMKTTSSLWLPNCGGSGKYSKYWSVHNKAFLWRRPPVTVEKSFFLNWLQDSEPADELRLKVAHGELGQRDCDVAAPLPVGQHLPEGSLLFTRKQEVIMITNFVSNDLQGHLCDSCWNKE